MGTLSKILLVDDVPLFLELEQSFLKGLGAEVLTAADGTEAIEAAGREKPDLIVMDLVMPQMNGDEACRKLKSDPLTQDIPVILVTAQGGEQAQGLQEKAACEAVLFKPLRRSDLLTQINRLLAEHEGAPLGQERRVLIIEESRFYASLLQDVLMAKSYRVATASTEAELRGQIESHLPDLILFDILLPNIDVFALLDEIRGNPAMADVAVVALTSLLADDPVARKARAHGVADFISKTTPPADIGYRIDEILFARGANTRRSPRYTLRLPIEYKKDQFWILGELSNISWTGLFVKALELPELGARIEIRFGFPHQKTPCQEQGAVVWVHAPEARGTARGNESGFGLRLLSRSDQFRQSFDEFRRRNGLS